MNIKEQKLFFTRNGQYSIWEKLQHLKDEYLTELYMFVVQKKWVNTMPKSIDLYPSFLFRVWKNLESLEDSELFILELDERFKQMEEPKFDFNGDIFHYNGSSYDLKSVDLNLIKLLKEANEVFEIAGLNIEYFLHGIINGINNVVDIRFYNERTTGFRGICIDDIEMEEHKIAKILREQALKLNYTKILRFLGGEEK